MNGPKEMKDEPEFAWNRGQAGSHQNQAYGNASANVTADCHYGMGGSYYPSGSMFPYSPAATDHHHTTAWSNGAAQDMGYLHSYGSASDQASHSNTQYMDGMFGAQNSFGFANHFSSPFFPNGSVGNVSASSGDQFWGNSSSKGPVRSNHQVANGPYRSNDEPSYYSRESYGDHSNIKPLESGVHALSLDHLRPNDQFSSKTGGFGGYESKKQDYIGSSGSNAVGGQKKMSWASVASQPAKQTSKASSLKSKMAASSVLASTSKLIQPSPVTSVVVDTTGGWEGRNGGSANLASKPIVQSNVAPQPLPQTHALPEKVQLPPPQPAPVPSWTSGPSASQSRPLPRGPPPPHNTGHGSLPTFSEGKLSHSNANHHRGPSSHPSEPHHRQHSNISGAKPHSAQHVATVSPQVKESSNNTHNVNDSNGSAAPVLDKLRVDTYNPKEFDLNPKNARFFIIKSYSEDDIHRSIKYSIWCSTDHGNKRLDLAFKSQDGKPVFLFFSVNASGHFCGMAQMVSAIDYNASSSVWAQDKWKGQFKGKFCLRGNDSE